MINATTHIVGSQDSSLYLIEENDIYVQETEVKGTLNTPTISISSYCSPTISGFTISSDYDYKPMNDAGINVFNSSLTLKDNIIMNNKSVL